MPKKPERQRVILEMIDEHVVASQEELKVLLAGRGWQVTQATLSRDLRELGIVRQPTPDGARYVRPGSLSADDAISLQGLLPQLFDRIDGVGELLVLHTIPSGAQPMAEAIDAQGWPEALGTIAGENTVLIICRSGPARLTLTERIERLARVT